MTSQSLSRSQIYNRREARHLQIRRIVEIVANGRSIPFTLYNLSLHGAAGRSIFPIHVDTEIVVRFEDGFAAAGQVRWTRNGMIGIAFRRRLPSDLLQPASRIRRRRSARFVVVHPALLVIGGQSAPCTIRNITTFGLMIETETDLKPGQIVAILSSEFDYCGQVRWASDGKAGIRTFTPVNLRAFDIDNTASCGKTTNGEALSCSTL